MPLNICHEYHALHVVDPDPGHFVKINYLLLPFDPGEGDLVVKLAVNIF